MDEIDWKIIDMLLRDARKTYSEIGNTLNLGKDTIHRKVKKLHKKGILGTPTIILNSEKCSFEGIVDFFINYNIECEDLKNIKNQFSNLPFILSIADTLGDYNLYISSFFRSFNDVKEIVQTIKKNSCVSSYEMVIYSKNISNPLLVPFIEGHPDNSILYKLHSKK
jgi:DNA-binding Lrp family transcriptional regulator